MVGSMSRVGFAGTASATRRSAGRFARRTPCTPVASRSVTRTRSPATVARVANDARAVRVPAHGVAASEHGQRAEALEPRHGASQPRIVLRCRAPVERGAAAARRRRPDACGRRPAVVAGRTSRASAAAHDTRARARASCARMARRSSWLNSAACRPRIAIRPCAPA